MLRLEDFPEAKVEKFGSDFVKVIQQFCEEHSLKMNNFPEDEIVKVFESAFYNMLKQRSKSAVQ